MTARYDILGSSHHDTPAFLPSHTHSVVIHTPITYHCFVEPVQMTARKVPASIAGLLQELELEQPIVV